MGEEIIDVVNPIKQCGKNQSFNLYALIPQKLREKRGINENTNLIVLLAQNGDIILRPQEA